MKPKNTLILLALAFALFGFIYFYESKLPTTRQNQESNKLVVSLDDSSIEIDGISITNNENKIELRKGDSGWEVVSPVKDRADAILVNQLLTAIGSLEVQSSFAGDAKDAKTSLADLGLETSPTRLKLLGKNAPPEIIFGKETAVDGKMYVRLDGSKTVYVVKNDLKSQISKKADDFRDHKLENINPAIVNKVNIKSPAGELEMVKERGEWSLGKPLKARGDNQAIADIVAQVLNAPIDTFLPEDGANLGAMGLNDPRGTITIGTEGSDKPDVLQIGQPTEKDKAKVYAKLSSRASLYILPKKIADVLNTNPNDVRDKHLLKLNTDMVDRIRIEPAGKPSIVLARKQEDWVVKSLNDAPANGRLVGKFMEALQALPVTGFVADVASDLGRYGLEKPQMKVTFSAYASENTAESTAGENPFLTIDFGKQDGSTVYARLENEPYIVSIPVKFFQAIPTDPTIWQDTSIFKFKPEEITSLEITRDQQAPLSLERTGSAWKFQKSPGAPNAGALQSLLNTLSSLHAVRWVGLSTSGLGFEKPAFTLTFSVAGGKPLKLVVSSSSVDNMWYARTDERNGVFLLSRPDYDAFQADLTDVPKQPAASVAPGGVQ